MRRRQQVQQGRQQGQAGNQADKHSDSGDQPELREVVLLRYMSDLSYAEIAQTLGWPIGTVGTRLHRALRQLADQLRFSSVVEEGS